MPPQCRGPIELVMSRSSPGRYALHEFAKNVFDVQATDGSGRALPLEHPGRIAGDVAVHDGTVQRALPRLRRSRGRHLPRGRYQPCARQRACRAHVGARPRRRGRRRRHRASSRLRLARGDPAVPHRGPVDVHRAESRVPGRQPDRGQPSRPARLPCTGGRGPRAEPADVPGAARAERARRRTHVVDGLRRIVAEEATIFGEYPAFDAGAVHVPGGLPAVGGRRRHGAPQQQRAHEQRARSRSSPRPCSIRQPTSSSTRGTWNASGRARSSRSISRRRTCRASCGWPRA